MGTLPAVAVLVGIVELAPFALFARFNILLAAFSSADITKELLRISSEFIKMSDAQAKIPLLGDIGSLNVSVATGIILYEAMKQRPA